LWDIDEEGNERVKEFVKDFGIKAFAYTVDIADRAQVDKFYLKVRKEVGDVTILFNNAGVANPGPFLQVPPEKLEKIVQVNLLAHFWTLRAVLPRMIEKNHGHVVTISSCGAFMGLKNAAVYGASKFGTRGFIDGIVDELRDCSSKTDKIQFTTVFPSFIKSNMTAGFRVKFRL
jgi:all-trans-retinol dehydrogenase (NAD+)